MKYVFHDNLFDWSIFSLGTLLLLLLPLLGIVFTYRRKRTTEQKRIIHFIVFVFLLEYISVNDKITEDIFNGTNYPIYHIGTLGLLGFLLSIYYRHLREHFGRRWFWIVVSGLWLICVWNMIRGDGIYSFPSVTAGLYSLTGIVVGISYLYHLLSTMSVAKLEKDPLFVATAGFLIYYSGNFLLWIFLTFITSDFVVFRSVYSVSAYLTIFLSLVLTTALIIDPKSNVKATNFTHDLPR